MYRLVVFMHGGLSFKRTFKPMYNWCYIDRTASAASQVLHVKVELIANVTMYIYIGMLL